MRKETVQMLIFYYFISLWLDLVVSMTIVLISSSQPFSYLHHLRQILYLIFYSLPHFLVSPVFSNSFHLTFFQQLFCFFPIHFCPSAKIKRGGNAQQHLTYPGTMIIFAAIHCQVSWAIGWTESRLHPLGYHGLEFCWRGTYPASSCILPRTKTVTHTQLIVHQVLSQQPQLIPQ